jgi:hypothetical protein
MADKIALTDEMLRAWGRAPPTKRIFVWDALQPHFGARISEWGTISFVLRKRIKGVHKVFYRVLATYPYVTLDAARERARLLLAQIAEGIDPRVHIEEEARVVVQPIDEKSFVTVATAYIAEHASKRVGGRETERIINTYLLPCFRNLQIGEISRLEIITLLDRIRSGQFESEHGDKLGGPSMADHVLANLRTLFNWYADRDDDFRIPLLRDKHMGSKKNLKA